MMNEEKIIMLVTSDRKYQIENARKLLKNRLEECYYTPDAALVQRKKYHDVFVYGTMKSKFSMHGRLRGAHFVGYGFTESNSMTMYRTKHKYSTPVVLFDTQEDQKARVYGEVWRIPSKTLFDLDFTESNGLMYERFKMTVRLGLPTQPKGTVRALMYLGKHSYWKQRLDDLILCDKLYPNKAPQQPYYNFMRKYTEASAN